MDMDVEEIDGGRTDVVLRGGLDTAGAGANDLKFKVIAGARCAVIVDLSLDETAFAVLRTAGIDQLMPILFDRGAAIAAVRQ